MYAATDHARSRHFGALSHAQFVMVVLKRVQTGYITIFNRESSTALALGYGLRVVSGYLLKDKKAALPECLAHEAAPVHWGVGSGVESRVYVWSPRGTLQINLVPHGTNGHTCPRGG